jgi:hypothetical protein
MALRQGCRISSLMDATCLTRWTWRSSSADAEQGEQSYAPPALYLAMHPARRLPPSGQRVPAFASATMSSFA